MSSLRTLLQTHVEEGRVPGAVAMVSRGGPAAGNGTPETETEIEAVGVADLDTRAPMTRESIFQLASISKPIVAAAVLMLVEDGRFALDDPVGHWLPELADPVVVRTPESPPDNVVPARRPITVFDVLASQAGHGFPSDFTLPVAREIFTVQPYMRDREDPLDPDRWLAALARIPLLHQPGEGWLYNTASDVQGVLIARASGQSLPDFLAERIFEPLGMSDTGFTVPDGKADRFTSYYRHDPDHDPESGGVPALVPGARPADKWSDQPVFPSGAGGLVGTLDDWHTFGRLLLGGGSRNGRRLLTPESVRLMMTDHTRPEHRAMGELFLEGQGWGFGGSVDIDRRDPWNVPGRYGWVGGTGTAAYVVPSTGAVSILLTQVSMESPVPPATLIDFFAYAAGA